MLRMKKEMGRALHGNEEKKKEWKRKRSRREQRMGTDKKTLMPDSDHLSTITLSTATSSTERSADEQIM
uniref:Uncharacterized protein n=1 Tax=Pristionchus pacificus TaxID=54126 RepID=A0A2A6CU48_PRIPA|eukprot:PDM81679.1 hypothetical protein PRIPAC_30660 [Pristionchus pacificus]